MRHLRRTRLAAVATLIGLGLLTTHGASATSRADEPRSTPVPIATADGSLFSYVVNVSDPSESRVRTAERAVRDAGGVVVQTWPQIGVIIAHSDRGNFARQVLSSGKGAIASAGPTRTVPVTEGTPKGDQAAWDAADRRRVPRAPIGPATPPSSTAPDPRSAAQWDMEMLKVPAAHEVTAGSRGVLVGALDSGIDADHPDLAGRIDWSTSVGCVDAGRPNREVAAWRPTASDHGTHVAGIIAAERNGYGTVGVAPGVTLASVKVVNDDGLIYPEYAICGFMWAGQQRMDITNNSYFIDPFEYWCADQPEQAPAREAVRRAVAWSRSRGTVHVAAAGNSSQDLAKKTTDPASPNDGPSPTPRTINSGCLDIPTELPGVVSVSSIERSGELSPFSNYGLGAIDVAAPGSGILSTVTRDNGWGVKSGTSMAAPQVAGVLALMKSAHPDLTPAEMTDRLRAGATSRSCPTPAGGSACVGTKGDNSHYGRGIVDALAAVR